MAYKDPFSVADHLRGLRPSDIAGFIRLGLAFVPGRIWHAVSPDIWVVSETADTARDNGYWLFRYIRLTHPDHKVYYPLRKTSSDYAAVAPLGNVVRFGSFKHFVLFWAANKYLGTTKEHGFPDERTCDYFVINNFAPFKYIFLNHGVARGYSKITDGNLTNYTLFIAMSEQEKRTVVALDHQPEEKVKAIGFCRHDNLNDSLLNKKMILFMPTWRKYLDFRHESDPEVIEQTRQRYLGSTYYKCCMELINNEELLSYLDENDLEFVVYLHGYAQMYATYLTSRSPRVTIARKEDYSVQDLLKEAAFLITDYSSVIFDFAYMKKPCCYFQFDAEQFAQTQYAESAYYSYERDGFGPVFTMADEVVDHVRASHRTGFTMPDVYRKRVESYFPSFGTDHCEKTYELIASL